MKTFKSLLAIPVALIMFANILNAQDVRFSQPYTVPLNVNPAIMGMYDDARFMINSRSQYGAIFQTYSFNGFYPVYYDTRTGNKLDIGLSMIMDKAGAFQNFNPVVAASYKLQLSYNNYLTGSISGGIYQKTLNTKDLTFDDQYVLGSFNGQNPTNELISPENIVFPDINFGLMWHMTIREYAHHASRASISDIYAGFSVFHANEPNESFTGELGVLPRRFSYQAGVTFAGDNRIDISPNIIRNFQQGNNDFAAGVYLYYNINETQRVMFGGWYRDTDAIALLFKLDFFDFELGYSYDIPNSDLGRSINGMHTHEISLLYKFDVKSSRSSKPKLDTAK